MQLAEIGTRGGEVEQRGLSVAALITAAVVSTGKITQTDGTQTNTFAGGIDMTGANQLLVPPGTVGAPGLAFHGDTPTGFYRAGAGIPAISANNTLVQEWTTAFTALLNNSQFQINQRMDFAAIQTASLSTNQDNFALGGATDILVVNNTAGANINFTGFSGGETGRILVFLNASAAVADTITLKHKTTSAASAQIEGANLADSIVRAGGGVILFWSNSDSLWHEVTI